MNVKTSVEKFAEDIGFDKNNLVLISFYNGRSSIEERTANSSLFIHKSKTLANLDKSYFVELLKTTLLTNPKFDKLKIEIIEK